MARKHPFGYKKEPKKRSHDEIELDRQERNVRRRVKYAEDHGRDPSPRDSHQMAVLDSQKMLMSTISQHNRDAIQTIHHSIQNIHQSSNQAATGATLQIMSALQNPTASRSAVQAPRAVAYREVISLVDSDNEKEEYEIIDLIDSDDDNTADYPRRVATTESNMVADVASNEFLDNDQEALFFENTFYQGDDIKVPTKSLIFGQKKKKCEAGFQNSQDSAFIASNEPSSAKKPPTGISKVVQDAVSQQERSTRTVSYNAIKVITESRDCVQQLISSFAEELIQKASRKTAINNTQRVADEFLVVFEQFFTDLIARHKALVCVWFFDGVLEAMNQFSEEPSQKEEQTDEITSYSHVPPQLRVLGGVTGVDTVLLDDETGERALASSRECENQDVSSWPAESKTRFGNTPNPDPSHYTASTSSIALESIVYLEELKDSLISKIVSMGLSKPPKSLSTQTDLQAYVQEFTKHRHGDSCAGESAFLSEKNPPPLSCEYDKKANHIGEECGPYVANPYVTNPQNQFWEANTLLFTVSSGDVNTRNLSLPKPTNTSWGANTQLFTASSGDVNPQNLSLPNSTNLSRGRADGEMAAVVEKVLDYMEKTQSSAIESLRNASSLVALVMSESLEKLRLSK